jgi:hypothetical protein
LGSLRGREHSEDLGIDGMIILNWIVKIGREGVYFIDLAQYTDWWRMVGEPGTENLGCKRGEEFLDQLSNCRFSGKTGNFIINAWKMWQN